MPCISFLKNFTRYHCYGIIFIAFFYLLFILWVYLTRKILRKLLVIQHLRNVSIEWLILILGDVYLIGYSLQFQLLHMQEIQFQ